MKIKYISLLLLAVVLTACQGLGNPMEFQPSTEDQTSEEISTESHEELLSEPVFQPGPCPFQLENEVDAQYSPECGLMVVPENRSDPNSNMIRLAVAWFHQPEPQPGAVPVVFIDGGPGISTLESLPYSITKFFPLMNEHDVIFYDQRGVGFSEPALDCRENEGFIRESLEDQLTPEETILRQFEVFEKCHARLVDQGIQLDMYNSLQSARDLEDLRTVLGIEKWNLYSVSYGTRVALETMRQYPEGIRSVVLDSVLPPDADPISESITNVGQALVKFFETCNIDQECSKAFPYLEELFYSTADSLNHEPAQVAVANLLTGEQYNSLLDGRAFIGIITQSLYSSELIPMIPMMIYEVSRGDYSKISSIRSSFLSSATFLSPGKYHSVLCHQEAPFSDSGKVESVLADYPQLKDYFSFSISHGKDTFAFCEMWDSGESGPEQNEPVASRIPTLVLGGKLDPSTPSRWGQQAAQHLDNSYFFEFETAGHSSSLSLPCPHSIVMEFLGDPKSKPESACISSMELSFTIPTQMDQLSFVKVEVQDFGISAMVPEGWIAVSPEYFVPADKSVELVISKNTGVSKEDFLTQWSASELVGETNNNGLEWEIYSFALPAKDVAGFIASSPAEDGFYFTLIVGKTSKQAALFENVFLPVLQSYSVIE